MFYSKTLSENIDFLTKHSKDAHKLHLLRGVSSKQLIWVFITGGNTNIFVSFVENLDSTLYGHLEYYAPFWHWIFHVNGKQPKLWQHGWWNSHRVELQSTTSTTSTTSIIILVSRDQGDIKWKSQGNRSPMNFSGPNMGADESLEFIYKAPISLDPPFKVSLDSVMPVYHAGGARKNSCDFKECEFQCIFHPLSAIPKTVCYRHLVCMVVSSQHDHMEDFVKKLKPFCFVQNTVCFSDAFPSPHAWGMPL